MYNKAWYSEHIAPAYLTNSKLHLWRDEHKQNFFAWIFTYIHFFFLQRSGLKGGGGKTLRRRGRFLCGLYLLRHRWCLVGGWFHYSMSAPPRTYSKQQFTINNYHFMLSARIFLLFSFFFSVRRSRNHYLLLCKQLIKRDGNGLLFSNLMAIPNREQWISLMLRRPPESHFSARFNRPTDHREEPE